MSQIYLAGGISGYTYDEAQEWRDYVADQFAGTDIRCYSPLRGKEFLKKEGIISKSYDYHPLASAKGILHRDHHDCTTSDLIFVNFLRATSHSVGTAMEVGWAFDHHILTVAVMEKDAEFNTHPMVLESITYRVETLDDGILIAKAILLP
jgi:nucleoside 2-deoxyribosyltransferase